jgi:hypothetical protein
MPARFMLLIHSIMHAQAIASAVIVILAPCSTRHEHIIVRTRAYVRANQKLCEVESRAQREICEQGT